MAAMVSLDVFKKRSPDAFLSQLLRLSLRIICRNLAGILRHSSHRNMSTQYLKVCRFEQNAGQELEQGTLIHCMENLPIGLSFYGNAPETVKHALIIFSKDEGERREW